MFCAKTLLGKGQKMIVTVIRIQKAQGEGNSKAKEDTILPSYQMEKPQGLEINSTHSVSDV